MPPSRPSRAGRRPSLVPATRSRRADLAIRSSAPCVRETTGFATGWGAGELTALLLPELDAGGRNGDEYMERLGFTYRDIEIEEDYGSVEEAVATYGFIYGRTAIDHLIARHQSSIRWKPSLYYPQV